MQPTVDYVVYILPQDSSQLAIWAQIGTVVIAVLALAVSVWQAKRNNEQHQRDILHARLMAKPHIDCQSRTINACYVFSISNNGLGPAVIKDINIFWNQKLQPNYSLENVLTEIFGGLLSDTRFTFDYIEINGYIPPGVTREVVRVNAEGAEFPLAQIKKSIEQEIYITGKYESVFGNEFEFDTRVSLETKIDPTDG